MNMKLIDEISIGCCAKKKQAVPPPPPLPPPFPRLCFKKSVPQSVTNQEIAKFWRQKRIVEEDHLLAAIKAAARIRARNLSEEDYRLFEESLEDDNQEKDDDNQEKDDANKEKKAAFTNDIKKDDKNNEVRVGIKDWWTKSKYAYLNQPAMEFKQSPKRRTSTYIPNCNLSNYKSTPLYPTFLGVF